MPASSGMNHEAAPTITGSVSKVLGILSLLSSLRSIKEDIMLTYPKPPIFSAIERIHAHKIGRPQPPLTSHEIEWQKLQLERRESLLQTPITEAEVALLQMQLDAADKRAANQAALQQFYDHPEEVDTFMEQFPIGVSEWQKTIEDH